MREFKYRKELLPFLEEVFKKNHHEYRIDEGKIYIDISGRKFHQAVVDAMCKKQEASYSIPHGVLPFEKWMNRRENDKKRKEFGGMPVALLKEDHWKLERAIKNGL